jgi:dolichol-phosphate mannosyltransferase
MLNAPLNVPARSEKFEDSKASQDLAISVIVPVYNEAANLPELHRRLTATLQSMAVSYELVFIDDGSQDQSLLVLKELQQQDPATIVLKLTRNFGQHPAIVAGLHRVCGEAVVLIDADLQNPPEEIPNLYRHFQEGIAVVYGIRATRDDKGWRKGGSQFVMWLSQQLLGVELPQDMISGFRIIHRNVVKALNNIREQQYDTSLMMLWLGFSHRGVVVTHHQRHYGESKYTTWKLIYLTVDMLVGFSDFPLRFASIMGSLLALLSILVGGYMALQRVRGIIDVPGYASVFVGITFLAGVQLLFLGIIGEYIARIYREMKGRPYYVVEEVYSSTSPATSLPNLAAARATNVYAAAKTNGD